MAGRLHLSDLPDFDPWELSRITYTDEGEVDLILPRMVLIRKVRTVEELDEALRDSEEAAGSMGLYVRENLLEETKTRWEQARGDVR